jgi:hypothetical protein
MEHVLVVLGLGALSGVITAVANTAFEQGWGAGQFFLIWLILLVVCYGGFVILDGDSF